MSVSPQPPPLPWDVRTSPERWLLILAGAGAGLAAIFLTAAQSCGIPWACAWRGMTGLPCAGCGGTRATLLLLHGEWWSAFILNPGVVIASALLVLAVIYAAVTVVFRREPWRPRWHGWRWWLAAAVAVNWLYLLAFSRP